RFSRDWSLDVCSSDLKFHQPDAVARIGDDVNTLYHHAANETVSRRKCRCQPAWPVCSGRNQSFSCRANIFSRQENSKPLSCGGSSEERRVGKQGNAWR